MNMSNLRGSGSSSIGKSILSELSGGSFSQYNYEIWIPDNWDFNLTSRFNLNIHSCKSGFINKLFVDNIYTRIKNDKIKCIFSFGDTGQMFSKNPHILMVQQAYLAYKYEELDFEISLKFRSKLKLMELYFKNILPTIKYIIVQNEDMKMRISNRWSFPDERIFVIPSTVNIIKHKEKHPKKEYPYICYIADSYSHKNHEIFPKIIYILNQFGIKLRCILTVTAKEVPKVIEYAKQLGVFEQFDFIGRVSEKIRSDILLGAIAHVMPSKLESFGLPYYEAMGLGCPSIVSDLPFAREALGYAGLYANSNSAEEFAEHIKELVFNNKLYIQKQMESKERYKTWYRPWETVTSQYLKLIDLL